MCVCVCVCVRARARACVRKHTFVCLCMSACLGTYIRVYERVACVDKRNKKQQKNNKEKNDKKNKSSNDKTVNILSLPCSSDPKHAHKIRVFQTDAHNIHAWQTHAHNIRACQRQH